jgi:hypothetical protein
VGRGQGATGAVRGRDAAGAHPEHGVGWGGPDDGPERRIDGGRAQAVDAQFPDHHRTRREGMEPPAGTRPGGPSVELDHHEPLRLASLRQRRALHRPRVHHGRGQRCPTQVPRQNLVSVDMAGEDRGESRGDVRRTDHVATGREGEVRRPHCRPLHALVHAQNLHRPARRAPARPAQQATEPVPDPTVEREPDEAYTRPPDRQLHRPGPVENVDPRVSQETRVRDPGPLVVPRHQEHRHASLRHAHQRLEALIGQTRLDLRPVEQVPAVHHQVHRPRHGRLQRRLVVRLEVAPAPAAPDPGPRREVEAQVRVGKEQDADRRRHGSQAIIFGFCSVGEVGVGVGAFPAQLFAFIAT